MLLRLLGTRMRPWAAAPGRSCSACAFEVDIQYASTGTFKNSKTVLLCRHMHALQLQQNSKAFSLADRIKQLSDSQRSYRV
jgi:hypothetical protein